MRGALDGFITALATASRITAMHQQTEDPHIITCEKCRHSIDTRIYENDIDECPCCAMLLCEDCLLQHAIDDGEMIEEDEGPDPDDAYEADRQREIDGEDD